MYSTVGTVEVTEVTESIDAPVADPSVRLGPFFQAGAAAITRPDWPDFHLGLGGTFYKQKPTRLRWILACLNACASGQFDVAMLENPANRLLLAEGGASIQLEPDSRIALLLEHDLQSLVDALRSCLAVIEAAEEPENDFTPIKSLDSWNEARESARAALSMLPSPYETEVL